MNRRTLIISNPGEPEEKGTEHYCEGVKIDVNNYIEFLTSALGGAWEKNEIEHIERPTVKQLDEKINMLRDYDYSKVIFCGHGFYSKKDETTVLALSKKEFYDSLKLRENTNKRTIILDCCRKRSNISLTESKKYAEFADMSINLNRDVCRKFYDNKIEECSKGLIVLYGCDIDEYCNDDPREGGLFSSSLLKAAENWKLKSIVNLSSYNYCMSTVSAFENSKNRIREKSGGVQNPQVEKPRTEPYFPFAVMG